MQILFSPQRRDDALIVAKAGDVITVNGEAFDFSSLPDGGTIPAGSVPCEFFAGPVERIGGELRVTLILPHGPNPPPAVLFPEPIMASADGLVALPGGSHVDA